MKPLRILAYSALVASVAAIAVVPIATAGAGTAKKRFPGTSGNDNYVGTPKRDVMYGLAGDDSLDGKGKGDRIKAGDGADVLYGREGNDRMWGGDGSDTIYGGPGNDRIYSKEVDDDSDTISCGAGKHDRVWAGAEDNVSGDCEHVVRV